MKASAARPKGWSFFHAMTVSIFLSGSSGRKERRLSSKSAAAPSVVMTIAARIFCKDHAASAQVPLDWGRDCLPYTPQPVCDFCIEFKAPGKDDRLPQKIFLLDGFFFREGIIRSHDDAPASIGTDRDGIILHRIKGTDKDSRIDEAHVHPLGDAVLTPVW